MKKIIVVHPGKQHSYHTAEGLCKHDMLLYYVTTVYKGKHSWTTLLGRFLNGDNKKRFLSRHSDIFDNRVIQVKELSGLLYLLLLRKIPHAKLTKELEELIHIKTYEKAICIASKSNADAVIVYGGFTPELFELRDKVAKNTKIIVDVPSVTNKFMVPVLENDIKITGNEYIRKEQASSWNLDGIKNIEYWSQHADGFLAGSNVVKRSLVECGANPNKVKIVPYGIDPERFVVKNFSEHNQTVKFIFVGNVNRRKGMQHLLPAFSRLDENAATLTVVGKYDSKDPLYQKYQNRKNILFKGFVTQNIVAELYRECDVFVLPSLGEGLAQVGIEAMSCGLPIICSENSGVNDLITDGKEGFVIPVSDPDAVYERLLWFVEHKDQINFMGKAAAETAHKYTWSYYEDNVVKAVNEIVEGERN